MSVYFAERDGLIKIGWSYNVPNRIMALRAELIGAIPGDRSIESSVHARFEHLRVHGEWFRPEVDLLAYIHDEAQNHEPDAANVQTAIRLPKSLLKRLDKLAERMAKANPDMRITRTQVLRTAMYRGVAQLRETYFPEAEKKTEPR
jgi:predicted DNA-binding protein